MKHRILALLFVILIVFGTVSCAKGNDSATGTNDTSDSSTTGASETDRNSIPDDLPNVNFNGMSYRMLIQERYKDYTIADTLTGDSVNKAIYNRNKQVENRFGVKIEITTDQEKNLTDRITRLVNTGDDQFDIVLGHTLFMGQAALQEIFYDWYELDEIDFSKPWFNQVSVANSTVNGKMYITISDICLSVASNTWCMFYNKDMATNYRIDSLYDLVRGGKWTVDKLKEITQDIYSDLNNNGSADEEDLFGFVTDNSNSLPIYAVAFDLPTVNITKDNNIEVLLGNDRSVTAVDKIKKLLFDSAGTRIVAAGKRNTMFINMQTMFVNTTLGSAITAFSDCDFDYGILPYPKLDEQQKNYYTIPGGSVSAMGVPTTAQNLEMIGIVTAALTAESWKNVVPVYCESVLKSRAVRDADSAEMIDIILDGRNMGFTFVFDAFKGYIYRFDDYLNMNIALSAFVEQYNNVVIKHFQDVLKLFK